MSETIEASIPRQQCLFLAMSLLFGDNTVHFGSVESAGIRTPKGRKGLFAPFLYPEVLFLGCFWLDLV